jgi:hypothetical protein
MSSESVCQVACSWVYVRSFHMCLFGVVYVTCGYFHDGSAKGTSFEEECSLRQESSSAHLCYDGMNTCTPSGGLPLVLPSGNCWYFSPSVFELLPMHFGTMVMGKFTRIWEFYS